MEHKDELIVLLSEVFAARPVEEWLQLLETAGVPCGPILAVEDLFSDEHVQETQGIIELEHPVAGPVWTVGLPFSLSATPLAVGSAAPALGEHTREVLAEIGFHPTEVADA